MADIQKILDTDHFEDIVQKTNAVMDKMDAVKEQIGNAYDDIQSNRNLIEQLEEDLVEVTPSEMNTYLQQLYA